jgi:hypothetical protein
VDAGVVSRIPPFPIGRKVSVPRKVDEVQRYRGSLVFDHKTGGTLQIFRNPEDFAVHKKITNRKGQQSILRNVLHAGGRLV